MPNGSCNEQSEVLRFGRLSVLSTRVKLTSLVFGCFRLGTHVELNNNSTTNNAVEKGHEISLLVGWKLS